MSELDKDLGHEENKDSQHHENNDLFEEETYNVQDNKDVKESYQDTKEELYEKGKDNGTQKKDPFEKSEDNSQKAEADTEEARPNETVNTEYSSFYKPPYYVPNFTVSDPLNNGFDPENNDLNKKRKRKAAKTVIAVVVIAIVSIAAFAFGAFSMGKLMSIAKSNSSGKLDLSGENEMIVVQNHPQMNIVKNPNTDYVPQNLPEVVQMVGNSVVEISTSSTVTDRFFGQYVTSGAGSGVFITQNDKAGYIITNHHVIDGATDIVVTLTNKEKYEAVALDSNKSLDLAVIRIEKKADENFTVAPIGDSSTLIVGQDVVAIGNPLGSLGGTVTDGIISALDRNVTIDGVSMTLLQHNAAINPGNSGGALFDMMGNLVGIVNAKTSDTGIEGLGFAIPVNIAFEYFKGVMQVPSLGVTVEYGYNAQRVYGVYVIKTFGEDTFKQYDRIAQINDVEIKTLNDYYACIDDFESGETVAVKVVRNNTEITLTVTVN
ncbi:MAG: trypsin-like serine protease [Ruminococcaceae bacterium]|nr:trypsin-like serine protease [Oscillospiraceae bacterium]